MANSARNTPGKEQVTDFEEVKVLAQEAGHVEAVAEHVPGELHHRVSLPVVYTGLW